MERIAYENGENTNEIAVIPLNFFPSKNDICRPNETGENAKCKTNMVDFS